MRPYRAQLHIHGPMSEGPASHMAHDHEAFAAGNVDIVWWMDHDWRIANFSKVTAFSFDDEVEHLVIPNRDPNSEVPETNIAMTWVEDAAGTNTANYRVYTCRQIVHSGSGSMCIELPPGGEGRRVVSRKFQVEVMHERYPLLSYPKVRLAIFPKAGVGEKGQVFVRFRLSQQPPDLGHAELVYVLGGAAQGTGKCAVVPLPWSPGRWNEYEFDLARDVERLQVPGGLDNALHRIYIGVVSEGPSVSAHFDTLEIEAEGKGPEMLARQRELVRSLPTRVQHHVGIEISYYGQHLNAYGSRVPIPDYEGLLPRRLTTRELVEHIHKYGGLASLNHPSVGGGRAALQRLIDEGAYGVDIIEVAHAHANLLPRLRLWDGLAAAGIIVTAVAGSDAHSAAAGWRAPEDGKAAAWITHFWAASPAEEDLMEALGRGRVYASDPTAFLGTMDLEGPVGTCMGDVVVTDGRPVRIAARVTGLEPGDLVAWLANGHLVYAGVADGTEYRGSWTTPPHVDRLYAVRLQVHRPSAWHTPYGGLIAFSNPLYVTNGLPKHGARRRIVRAVGEGAE